MKKTQQQKVLQLLKEAGSIGVNSYTFTFKERIKQIATRIFELKKQGYNIASVIKSNRSAQYILIEGSMSLYSHKAIPPVPPPNNPWDGEENLIAVTTKITILGKEKVITTWEKPGNIKPVQEALAI